MWLSDSSTGMNADSMPVFPETEPSPERWAIRDVDDDDRCKIEPTLNPRVVLESIRISKRLLDEAIDSSSKEGDDKKPALKLKLVLAHDKDEKIEGPSETNNETEQQEKKPDDDEDTDVGNDSDSSGELTIVQDELNESETEEEAGNQSVWNRSNTHRKATEDKQSIKIRKRRHSQKNKNTYDPQVVAKHVNGKRRRFERERERHRAEEISRAIENEAVAKRIAMEFSNIRRFRVSSSNDVAKSECTSSTETRSTQLNQQQTSNDTNTSGSSTPKLHKSPGPASSNDVLPAVAKGNYELISVSDKVDRDTSSSGAMTPQRISPSSAALKKPATKAASPSYSSQLQHHHIPVNACPAPRPAPLLRSAPHRSPLSDSDGTRLTEVGAPLRSTSSLVTAGSSPTATNPKHGQVFSPPTIRIPSPLLPEEISEDSEDKERNPDRGNLTSPSDASPPLSRNQHTSRPSITDKATISIDILTNSTPTILLAERPRSTGGNSTSNSSLASRASTMDTGDLQIPQRLRTSIHPSLETESGQMIDSHRESPDDTYTLKATSRSPQFNPKLSAFSVDNLTRSDPKAKTPPVSYGEERSTKCQSPNQQDSVTDRKLKSRILSSVQQPIADSSQRTTQKVQSNQSTSPGAETNFPVQDMDTQSSLPTAAGPPAAPNRFSLADTVGLIQSHESNSRLWDDSSFCPTTSPHSKVRVVRENDFQFVKPNAIPRKFRSSTTASVSIDSAPDPGHTLPLPNCPPHGRSPAAVSRISNRLHPGLTDLTSGPGSARSSSTRLTQTLQESKSAIIWKYIESQSGTNSMQTIDRAIESVRTRLVGLSDSPPTASTGLFSTSEPHSPIVDSGTILGCYLQGQRRERAGASIRSPLAQTESGPLDSSLSESSLSGAAISTRAAESNLDAAHNTRLYNLHQLKRVLVTIQRFSTTISMDAGKSVYHSIYALASGSSTIEEFVVRVHRTTKLTIRSNVARFISIHLPHLQKEITVQAASFKMSSSRYMRSNPECLIDPNLEPGDPQEVFLFDFETSLQPPSKRSTPTQISSHSQSVQPASNHQTNLPQSVAITPTSVAANPKTSPSPADGTQEREILTHTRSPSEAEVQGFTPPLGQAAVPVKTGLNENTKLPSGPLHQPYIDIQNNLLLVQEMLDRVSKLVQSTKKQISKVQQLEQWQLRQHLHPQKQEQRQQNKTSTSSDPARCEAVPVSPAVDSLPQESLQRGTPANIKEVPRGRNPTSLATKAPSQPRPGYTDGLNHRGVAITTQKSIDLHGTGPGDPERCWNCGRSAEETCSGCKLAKYCGSFCQHRDWEIHHRICPVIAASKPSLASLAAALT